MGRWTTHILRIGDFVKLKFDLIENVSEAKGTYTFSVKSLTSNEVNGNIVLPKARVFERNPLNNSFFGYNIVQFKILGIYLRPKDKFSGERRKLLEYENLSVQKMMSNRGYFFIVEDSIYHQLIMIKASYFMPVNSNK